MRISKSCSPGVPALELLALPQPGAPMRICLWASCQDWPWLASRHSANRTGVCVAAQRATFSAAQRLIMRSVLELQDAVLVPLEGRSTCLRHHVSRLLPHRSPGRRRLNWSSWLGSSSFDWATIKLLVQHRNIAQGESCERGDSPALTQFLHWNSMVPCSRCFRTCRKVCWPATKERQEYRASPQVCMPRPEPLS